MRSQKRVLMWYAYQPTALNLYIRTLIYYIMCVIITCLWYRIDKIYGIFPNNVRNKYIERIANCNRSGLTLVNGVVGLGVTAPYKGVGYHAETDHSVWKYNKKYRSALISDMNHITTYFVYPSPNKRNRDNLNFLNDNIYT